MKRAVLVVFVLALLPLRLPSSDTPLDRTTLKGVTSLKVAVDALPADLESAGLTVAGLRTRVEGRLQKAGLTVDPGAHEFVGIRLLAVKQGKADLGVCFALGLYQRVGLERDKTIRTVTETWEAESIILVRAKQLQEAAEGTVDQLVNQFVDAYESANSK
ncbi:MAG: hypothetical protein U0Q18_35285 [Bryobacteraceae bacterium]